MRGERYGRRACHDRMPVILDEGRAEDWINPGENDPLSLKRLIIPAPADLLVMQPASRLANSVNNEGPELLKVDEKKFELRP